MESGKFMPPASSQQETSRPRSAGQHWIQLNSSDSTAGIVVTAVDGDSFALTKKSLMKGGRLLLDTERLLQQVNDLMRELADWIQEHGANIEKAFLTFGGEAFQLLVLQRDKPFDSELEDALTDLDIRIAQNVNYDLIRFGVLALPQASEETIRSFLPPNGSVVYENAR